NPKGKLANMKDKEKTFVFLLPPEAEDQGLAMTNSFTCMALTALVIPKLLSGKSDIKTQINILSDCAREIIDEYASLCFRIAQTKCKRIVLHDRGPLWGTAKESHLKVQELTNDEIIGKFDSFLGFRHRPKAIIND